MTSGRASLWTLIGVVVFFKVWGVLLILLHDQSAAALEMMLVMNWYIVLPVGLITPAAMWWYRLLRVRAKRKRLILAEWRVERPSYRDA